MARNNISDVLRKDLRSVCASKAGSSELITIVDAIAGASTKGVTGTVPDNLAAKTVSTSWPGGASNQIRCQLQDDAGTSATATVRASATHRRYVVVTATTISEVTLTDASGAYERVLPANQADACSITDGTTDLATWQTTTGSLRRKYAVPVELNDSGTATASGTGGTSTVTLSKQNGVITTDAITTAAGAAHVITVTNTLVAATSRILVTLDKNSSAGTPVITSVTPGSGSFTVEISNLHASVAVNAALKVHFLVLP